MNRKADSASYQNQTQHLDFGLHTPLTPSQVETLTHVYTSILFTAVDALPVIHDLENLQDMGFVFVVPGYWSDRIHHPARWICSLAGERWLIANHALEVL